MSFGGAAGPVAPIYAVPLNINTPTMLYRAVSDGLGHLGCGDLHHGDLLARGFPAQGMGIRTWRLRH